MNALYNILSLAFHEETLRWASAMNEFSHLILFSIGIDIFHTRTVNLQEITYLVVIVVAARSGSSVQTVPAAPASH